MPGVSADGWAECIWCNWRERKKLPQWLRDEDKNRRNWYFLDMSETEFRAYVMNKMMSKRRSTSKRMNAIDHLSTDMNPYIICPTQSKHEVFDGDDVDGIDNDDDNDDVRGEIYDDPETDMFILILPGDICDHTIQLI